MTNNLYEAKTTIQGKEKVNKQLFFITNCLIVISNLQAEVTRIMNFFSGTTKFYLQDDWKHPIQFDIMQTYPASTCHRCSSMKSRMKIKMTANMQI